MVLLHRVRSRSFWCTGLEVAKLFCNVFFYSLKKSVYFIIDKAVEIHSRAECLMATFLTFFLQE